MTTADDLVKRVLPNHAPLSLQFEVVCTSCGNEMTVAAEVLLDERESIVNPGDTVRLRGRVSLCRRCVVITG